MSVEVHTPSEWGESFWFFEGIEDKRQRRALALISHFGTPGGGDRVCFVGEMVVIASPPGPMANNEEITLTVLPLDEFITNFSAGIDRDVEPSALRWVEKIVHWPELGC